MLIPGTRIGVSRCHGVGVIASRAIARGTVVWLPCPACPVWPREVLARMPAAEQAWLDEQGYYLESGSVLLPCHGAHRMNHSCEASVLDFDLDFGIAVRDITEGDEVTCDYRTFSSDPTWRVTCHCQTATCALEIAPGAADERVRPRWAAAVAAAVARIRLVPQPLHELARAASPLYARLVGDTAADVPGSARSSIRRPAFIAALTGAR